MAHWEFRDFCSPLGRNQIAEWYNKQGSDVQAEMDVFLQTMSVTQNWVWPQWDSLHGKQKGLYELRFKVRKVQYRLIAFREGSVCTLLIACTHKQDVYNPTNALDTAVTRRKQLANGEATTRDHDSE